MDYFTVLVLAMLISLPSFRGVMRLKIGVNGAEFSVDTRQESVENQKHPELPGQETDK